MKNPIYEQTLTKNGVEWEYVADVPLESIDAVRSLRNQARLETPLDGSLVEAYAIADKDGDQFPPLVVWRPGSKGRWILIDGNQRLAAKKRNNRKITDVYIVKNTDPQVIDRLTWTINNSVNGRRLTHEESLRHAISFVRKYGVTLTAAAKEWGVSLHTLQFHIKVAECREILQRNNVPTSPTLSDRNVANMSPLVTMGEDLFVKAVSAVSQVGATADDIEDLVRCIRRAKTTDDKEKQVDDFLQSEKAQERRAETKGGKVVGKPNSPRSQFLTYLRKLCHLLEDYQKEAICPRGQEFKDTRLLAGDVVNKLTSMYGLGAFVDVSRNQTEVG